LAFFSDSWCAFQLFLHEAFYRLESYISRTCYRPCATCAWIAVTGSWDWRIVPLSLALLTYIAGFDILYACQDIDFDRQIGLYSLPVKLGVGKALLISSILHCLTFIFLAMLIPLFGLGRIYGFFLIVIGLLLIWEHRMVKPEDLSKVPVAFFHVNSIVSIALFAGVGLDVLYSIAR